MGKNKSENRSDNGHRGLWFTLAALLLIGLLMWIVMRGDDSGA